jgi:uncharacterized 2Fe-2S/4Fe-4S cluster protein (DUF4445 family)
LSKTTPTDDPLVLFMPSGKRGRFAVGTPVLDAARELGVYVESVCGGRGICGRCQISVAVIDVPTEAQTNRQLVRKRAENRKIARDLATRLYYIEVSEPDMHSPLGDLDRLKQALADEWQIDDIRVDLSLVQSIQPILRAGEWKVTVAVHHDDNEIPQLVAAWPGFRDKLYGLAVDIGSTTIAAHLVDMMNGRPVASAGTSNPQIRFGEDLMSRVSYLIMNPDGLGDLTWVVREAVGSLINKVAGDIGIDPSDILEGVFVGNPIMHHIFLGIDPKELGTAPFALAISSAYTTTAAQLGLPMHPNGRIYTLPCIAGHVGADAAGATLAEGPHQSDDVTLLVDVGTNAEIVLGNKQRLLAASSPTGPAFEGAEISCGQRAAPGAIERVRIDPVTLEPRIRVIGVEAWSDEDEFAEKIDQVGVTGVCGSGIIEALGEMFLAGVISEDGVINGSAANRSDRVFADGRTFSYRLWHGSPELIITQNDIRAIQLAKAALYAGARLLMDKLGVDTVDRVKLAGAFGSYIDPKYAMILGLIPDCDLKKVAAVGNAAGTGARMCLLNRGHRREIESLVREIEKIETALEPKFQDHFVNAMALPNKSEPFPKLRAEVTLPVAREEPNGELPGGRRRTGRRTKRPAPSA